MRCCCARHDDGSVTTSLCPLHADTDPCLTMARVTGRRRTGTIRRGVCTSCGHGSAPTWAPATVTETIRHGDYRNVRSAPFAGPDSFRDFLAESPYRPGDVATVAATGYRVLMGGWTFEHGWARYVVTRTEATS